MVRVISVSGLPEGMLDGLDGWAASEFTEANEGLLEALEVPVPEIKAEKTHPWGLPAKVAQEPTVVSSAKQRVTGEQATSLSIPGNPKRVKKVKERKDPAAIRQMILEAKRRAKG